MSLHDGKPFVGTPSKVKTKNKGGMVDGVILRY